jgi:hypothetical protein
VVNGLDENTTGRSLWPALLHPGPEGSTRRLTFAAAPGLDGAVMARSRKWKLIHAPRNGFKRGQGHGRGRSRDLEYVFDLEADPSERHNIAGTPDLEIAWMRTRLSAWVETQRRLQPSPGDQQMDSETREQLEALGYLIED